MGAVVTSCGRLFYSGMVLGKSSVCCLVGWNVVGDVVIVPGGSHGVVDGRLGDSLTETYH